jgi:nucleoside-diphosphate-sugar epimerase
VKRVVVTGATGFIGRHALAPLVARGYQVHAATIDDPIETAGVTWHRCDLLSDSAVQLVRQVAPSHLLHLAWYAVPGKYWTSRANVAWLRASLALYEAFVAAGGARVVTAGSSAEYAWDRGPCRERATPLLPRTYYGTCKRALGEVIEADAAVAGVSAAHARFFFLYGPHEYRERLVANVVRALLRGEVARCSPGAQRRDFLHVADAAAATVALLDGDARGSVNIASGEAVTVRAVVEQAQAIVGTGRVDFGALPADPDPEVVADVARLRDEVGWRGARSLDVGLRDTIEWWSQRSGSEPSGEEPVRGGSRS